MGSQRNTFAYSSINFDVEKIEVRRILLDSCLINYLFS
jgi:hypothetical protein